jgi:cell division protein FtsQ
VDGEATLSIDPRISRRRTEVRRERSRRRLRWIGIAAAVVGVVGLGVGLLHTGLFAARHVTVRGARHTTVRQLEMAAGLESGPPLIDVSASAAAARIEALPWVDHAAVARHWPDSVSVSITERVAVATLPRPGGVALVDRTRRVLAWASAAPSGLVNLRVTVKVGRPGTTLPRAAGPGLHVAAVLPAILRSRVAAVVVDSRGDISLDLGSGLTATLGTTSDLAAKFESLASVLAGANPHGPGVIDVTVPEEPTFGPTPAPAASHP